MSPDGKRKLAVGRSLELEDALVPERRVCTWAVSEALDQCKLPLTGRIGVGETTPEVFKMDRELDPGTQLRVPVPPHRLRGSALDEIRSDEAFRGVIIRAEREAEFQKELLTALN